MSITKKALKKVAVTTFLSTVLISSFVTPAFAIPASLPNQIGNELQAEFTVMEEVDAVDTVVLSWNDADPFDTNKKNYDLTKNVEKTVTYYVSPGADNDDDISVSVLLSVPVEVASALDTLKVDGVEVDASELSDSSNNYYVLNEGLDLLSDAGVQSFDFDIAFKDVSPQGIPFSASLIAVKKMPTLAPAINLQASLQKTDPTQGYPLIMYLNNLNLADGEATGTLVVELGDLTPSLSDGIYGIIGTHNGQFDIESDWYDAASNTFTVPVPVGSAADYADLFRLNGVTYGTEPDSEIKVKLDQDGEGTDYTFGNEVTLRYTLQLPN